MTDERNDGVAGGKPALDEYELTILLERLESLVEEMDEAGVADRAAAEPFPTLVAEMDELGITSRAETLARIALLNSRLDSEF